MRRYSIYCLVLFIWINNETHWLWPFSYPSLFSCFSNKLLQTVKILNFISLKSTVVKLKWLFNHVSICFQILGYYKQYVLWNFLNYVTNKAVLQGFERVFFSIIMVLAHVLVFHMAIFIIFSIHFKINQFIFSCMQDIIIGV